MKSIEIYGGNPLQGVIKIQGSKNAALPIIAAAILNKGTSVLHNCPKIIDVLYMCSILESIGCVTKWEGKTLIINASQINSYEIPQDYAETMRSSIILLGSLIGRTKQAMVSFPGGCVIGARPIDLHLTALEQMNVKISEENGILSAEAKELKGAEIEFKSQSVGATENAILAAVLAAGDTSLTNCAKEPEIVELSSFLNKMGADISGAGTSSIQIKGVEKLHDTEYEIVSDRIVAGTYAMAAIGTDGDITIENPPLAHLQYLKNIAEKMGAVYEESNGAVRINGRKATKALPIVETVPYPGFPTDMQSQLLAALCTADGKSIIKEHIFEARFKAVEGLKRMGADIDISGEKAVIKGVAALSGADVMAQELRGGAALVIAGLMANGRTTVGNRHFIDRGYEDICRDMKMLGGNIS